MIFFSFSCSLAESVECCDVGVDWWVRMSPWLEGVSRSMPAKQTDWATISILLGYTQPSPSPGLQTNLWYAAPPTLNPQPDTLAGHCRTVLQWQTIFWTSFVCCLFRTWWPLKDLLESRNGRGVKKSGLVQTFVEGNKMKGYIRPRPAAQLQ